MNLKFDAIVIGKILYREQDLIIQMLLENGHKMAAVVYGGRRKKVFIELGNAYHFEISNKKNNMPSILHFNSRWMHKHIRYDYNAYTVLSFFIEVIGKIATEIDNPNSSTIFSGRFLVLSNALFFLDDAVKSNNFFKDTHLFLFMVKLLRDEGLIANSSDCDICKGSVVCGNFCLYRLGPKRQEFIKGWQLSYASYKDFKASRIIVKYLYDYLLSHLNNAIHSIELH